MSEQALVEVNGLRVEFAVTRGALRRRVASLNAVDGVDLRIARGESVGLVGESGSGKTTLGRAILRLHPLAAGSVRYDGVDLATLSGTEMRRLRRRMQMIFQDPYASLDPRMSIGDTVAEPLEIHGLARAAARRARVDELLRLVGLDPAARDRFPHEFSGGQRQRVGIARSLAVDPEFVVADEPISALDVSIQAQILNLLEDLRDRLGLTFLFIAHDLSVVRYITDRVAVMYLGRIVEQAPSEELYRAARHPYTAALLSAVPIPDPPLERRRRRIVLAGEMPSPVSPPSGCRFRTRCWKAQQRCTDVDPPLRDLSAGHAVACHFPEP